MKVLILGCGRLGATLATQLDQAGHEVHIIDRTLSAFQLLEPTFRGFTVVGDGLDEDVLKHAGLATSDAIVIATHGDNHAMMVSQMARTLYQVERISCRVYDPIRAAVLSEQGMEVFCPTVVIAERFFETLTSN
jgi:trk system potassium uptake protein TrkA